MDPIRIGSTFKSYEELDEKIKEFCNKNYVHFYKREARTLRCVANKIKKVARANQNLIYYTLKFTCVFGGRRYVKNKRSAGLRITKTSRQNCGAYIRLGLSEDLQHLEIADINLNHNHEVSEELYKNHVLERRLPQDLQEKVASLLHFQADKRLLQKQIMMETGKVVKLKDLDNISQRFKNTNSNWTLTVKLLLESYNTCIALLEEEKELVGIFFQDQLMTSAFGNSPQFLILDTTYPPACPGFKCIIFLAENGNGAEIISVGLLASEDEQSVSWLLHSFKKYNTDWNKIETLLMDKDFGDQIIAKEFPNAQIFYQYHGYKTFERDVSSNVMGLSEEQQKHIKQYFEQLCSVQTEAEYWELYEKFVIDTPITVLNYFDHYWHNVRDHWTLIKPLSREVNPERFEELHSKLESMMCSTSVTDFIKEFFIALYSLRDERNLEESIFKKPVLTFNKNTPAAFYQSLLKPSAFKQLLQQLEICSKDDVQLLSPDLFVYSEDNNCMIVDEVSCSCAFNVCMKLPCRHIFAVRLHLRESLFDKKLCDASWIKPDLVNSHNDKRNKASSKKRVAKRSNEDNCKGTEDIKGEIEDVSGEIDNASREVEDATRKIEDTFSEIVVDSAKETEMVLSKEEKYKKACTYTNRLAEVMSESSGANFDRKMEVVNDLIRQWEDEKDVFLLDMSQQNVLYLVPANQSS